MTWLLGAETGLCVVVLSWWRWKMPAGAVDEDGRYAAEWGARFAEQMSAGRYAEQMSAGRYAEQMGAGPMGVGRPRS